MNRVIQLEKNPELDGVFYSEILRAKYASISKTIPICYLAIIVNSLILSIVFSEKAPTWLSLYIFLALIATCAGRFVVWRHKEPLAVTSERVAREVRHTNAVAATLTAAFCSWCFALFPYGDTHEKALVAFTLAASTLGAMLCLTHLRSAAYIVGGIGGVASLVLFVASGVPALIATAVNLLVVIAALSAVILLQGRDFARMAIAQGEARRRELERRRLLHMIDDMPVAVMTVEPGTLIVNYANETSKALIRKIEHLLPIKADALIGTSIDVFHKHPQHQRRILADPGNLPHAARIQLGPEVLDLKVSAVMDSRGSYIGPMLTWALVTKEVEAESRIRQLAHYDMLTGLPNRVTFHDALTSSLADPDGRVGLLLIDLDGFKLVNDTRGHRMGDIVLTQVAARLHKLVAEYPVTASRLGGDEFAILLPKEVLDASMTIARRVIDVLSAPYEVGYGRGIELGATVGIALAPEHGADADLLLTRADMALYAAKAAGKGRVLVFAQEMEKKAQERARLEIELRAALDGNDEIFVFYQPIIDIETGNVTAREALLRWHHAQRGWISPTQFVPVAEQSGLIDRLGAFVLSAACSEAAGWQDGARVAVNISGKQLGKGTLAPAILAALVKSGLSPDRLEIEVTETSLHASEMACIDDLRRLRDMGVRVALDDFGTGYSSLSHLQLFPFDKIKIDGSFVKNATERRESAAVIRAVADLGRRLGVTIVAEGVETQEQLDRIREEGCTEVQGYFFGRPVPLGRDVVSISKLKKRKHNKNKPVEMYISNRRRYKMSKYMEITVNK